MTRKIDLTGHTYGNFTVQGKSGISGKWECICQCGNIKNVSTTHLRSGHTKSCGCSKFGNVNGLIHGMHKTPEYAAWVKMNARCENKNTQRYESYGGRGISVCQEWKDSFQRFYDHIGARPDSTYSLDRIDNNKNYEVGNVRWAKIKTQNNNKRNNIFITVNGQIKTVSQWSEITGLSQRMLGYRAAMKWPESEILSPSKRKKSS